MGERQETVAHGGLLAAAGVVQNMQVAGADGSMYVCGCCGCAGTYAPGVDMVYGLVVRFDCADCGPSIRCSFRGIEFIPNVSGEHT